MREACKVLLDVASYGERIGDTGFGGNREARVIQRMVFG
jgi:hypothetical protein